MKVCRNVNIPRPVTTYRHELWHRLDFVLYFGYGSDYDALFEHLHIYCQISFYRYSYLDFYSGCGCDRACWVCPYVWWMLPGAYR